jgi:2-polyprenyl-3-methyl-5-hydroxy-6-metoxy-1,4-benzoquinol methylase
MPEVSVDLPSEPQGTGVTSASFTCKVCGGGILREFLGFSALPRVTSDCVPFRDGGRLFICAECGAAQEVPNDRWSAEINEIYNNYRIYHQAGGVEQQVLDAQSGALRSRSEILLNRLTSLPDVPRSGKVLDVGCGTGGTLRAFDKVGGWLLYGLEMDQRNLAFLRAIPSFQALYTGTASKLDFRFDVITLVHVVEHLTTPCETLAEIGSKLAPEGRLFIQVPDAAVNPFDYVVADHLVHFTPDTLARLVRRAGLQVEYITTGWVKKEISLVARNGVGGDEACSRPTPTDEPIAAQIDWLRRLVDDVCHLAVSGKPFGILGTSIAATWIWPYVKGHVSFFVEEDTNRIGRKHMGCPILSPEGVPSGAVVYIALTSSVAEAIYARLSNSHADYRLPPRMPA